MKFTTHRQLTKCTYPCASHILALGTKRVDTINMRDMEQCFVDISILSCFHQHLVQEDGLLVYHVPENKQKVERLSGGERTVTVS